jgi:trans-2-enoyl-CoA reductase
MNTLNITDEQYEVLKNLVERHVHMYKQEQLTSMVREMDRLVRNGNTDMDEYQGLVMNYSELIESAEEVEVLFDKVTPITINKEVA